MSTWLTRLRLNPRSRDVRRDLRSAVALHRRVMSLLPDGLGEAARRNAGVLYRSDETRSGVVMLVQTCLEPDLGRLPERYAEAAVTRIDALLDGLLPKMLVRYRLAANTSKRLSIVDGKHKAGQVVALKGPAIDAWWTDRAAKYGLTLLTADIVAMPTAVGQRQDSQSVCHAITRFDGVAMVADVELVRAAIRGGIGRGKSYGCGLLSIAPART